MNINQLQQASDDKRRAAKQIFGEALGRNGWLNDQLPMSRFVDAVISAAVLEIQLVQARAALEEKS